MDSLFSQALDVRVAFEKAEIFGDQINGYEAEIEAHILGAEAQRARRPEVPELFRNVPALHTAWREGCSAAITGGGWSRFEEAS